MTKEEIADRIAALEKESGIHRNSSPTFSSLTDLQWLFVLLYTREVPLKLEDWCAEYGFAPTTVSAWLKNDKVVTAINKAYVPALKRKAVEGLNQLYEIFTKTGNIKALDLFLKHMSLDKARLADTEDFKVTWDLSGQRWTPEEKNPNGGNKSPASPNAEGEDQDGGRPLPN